jgi:hypothetical protein
VAEEKKTQLCLNVLSQETEWLTRRFSKFEKMVRMLAWMWRFTNNYKPPTRKRKGELGVDELNFAEHLVFRLSKKRLLMELGIKDWLH